MDPQSGSHSCAEGTQGPSHPAGRGGHKLTQPGLTDWPHISPDPRDQPYLHGAGPDACDDHLLALGLVGHLDAVPHLDVLLQDEAAAEGPFALRAESVGRGGEGQRSPTAPIGHNPDAPPPFQDTQGTPVPNSPPQSRAPTGGTGTGRRV